MGYMKIVNVGLGEGWLAVCQSYILIHFVIFYQPTPPPTQRFSQSESQSWIRGGVGAVCQNLIPINFFYYYSLPTYLPTPPLTQCFVPREKVVFMLDQMRDRWAGCQNVRLIHFFFSLSLLQIVISMVQQSLSAILLC